MPVRFAGSPWETSRHPTIFAVSTPPSGIATDAQHPPSSCPRTHHTIPAFWSGCSRRRVSFRRGYDDGRRLRVELLPAPDDATTRIVDLLARYERESAARAERMIGFAAGDRCRHEQVAEHFGEQLVEPCGGCDVCDPRPKASRERPTPTPLPDNPAASIIAAVAALRWPVGRRSLVAMLRGSVSAPASARRSSSFGLLAAASESTVTKWVTALETAGALRVVEDDGFRVLHAVPGVELPAFGGGGAGLCRRTPPSSSACEAGGSTDRAATRFPPT